MWQHIVTGFPLVSLCQHSNPLVKALGEAFTARQPMGRLFSLLVDMTPPGAAKCVYEEEMWHRVIQIPEGVVRKEEEGSAGGGRQTRKLGGGSMCWRSLTWLVHYLAAASRGRLPSHS